MDTLQPGHFWKIPFVWDHGCAVPPPSGRLEFVPTESVALEAAVAAVMAASIDESDRAAVSELGAAGAARELLEVDEDYFQLEPTWWRFGQDRAGAIVGLVLPVLLRQAPHWKDGQPQGTIYYMGVLPEHRGTGYGRELLVNADLNLTHLSPKRRSKFDPPRQPGF